MFCNQCGATVPDGAKFCNACGARLPAWPGSTASAPAPAPASGGLVLHRTVTEQQVRNEEVIRIEDSRLPRAVSFRLAADTADGEVYRLSASAGNSYFEPFQVVVHVESKASSFGASGTDTAAASTLLFSGTRSSRSAASASGTSHTPTPVPTPGYRPTPAPAPSYKPAPAPAPEPAPEPMGGGSSAFAATDRCIFRLAEADKLNGFKMGGDDNGNVDVYGDRLELFRKSTGVALAFGAIGSAIEGKGKLFLTLRPDMVTLTQPMEDKKGRLCGFVFTLRDGRMLRLHLKAEGEAVRAIRRVFR